MALLLVALPAGLSGCDTGAPRLIVEASWPGRKLQGLAQSAGLLSAVAPEAVPVRGMDRFDSTPAASGPAPSPVSWRDLWEQHPIGILVLCAALLLSGLLSLGLLWRNRQLKAQKELFGAVVSQASDGIVVIDTESLGFVQFNDAACAALGYARNEFARLSLSDVQAELDTGEVRRRTAEIIAAGSGDLDTLHRHKDGSLRHVRTSNQVIHRDGRPYLAAIWVDITERLAVQRALRDSETRFRETFEQAAVGIAHVAPDGHWLRVNQKLCDILGYGRDELLQLSFQDLTYPDDLNADLSLLEQTLRDEISSYRMEKRYLHKNGDPVWAELTVALVRRDDGSPDYFISVVEDIGQRKQDRAALEQASVLYRGLIENMRDGVAVYQAVDDGNDFVFVTLNPAGARSSRLRAEDVIGRRVREVFPGIEAIGLFEVFQRVYRSGEPEAYKVTRYQDERIELWVENYVYKLPSGELVAVFADVSEQKAAEQALLESQATLEQMAYYDVLTGLPNRRLLLDRLGQALAVADRGDAWLAVCYLDLDGFKPVNDQHGRDTGDLLLRAVADRLQGTVGPSDTVARWGGDEFALLLIGLSGIEACEERLELMLRQLAEPYQVQQHSLSVSASIGVALYPQDNVDADALLRHADQAMYLAKQRGRNRFQFFDPTTDDLATAHREWLRRIARALEEDELCLVYQPIVDMRRGHVEAVEALVRWRHTEQGLLLPSAFLPMIEGGDLIRQLDRWVLERALEDLAQWARQGLSLGLHVNVSTHSLTEVGFIPTVQSMIRAHSGLRPEQIGIEILESAALEDLDACTDVIRKGRAAGLRFALDNFGSGYSSLTYFRHLPADIIKVDQGFVRDMLRDQNDLRIVEAVIGLGRAFSRSIIGEGVESEAHGLMLLRFGCDLGQGNGIARPMPAEQVASWLQGYRQPRHWHSAAANIWKPEDLPLLTMETEHRGWVDAILRQARGDADATPPVQDERNCRFGRWYNTDGRRQYGHLGVFRDMAPLHSSVHALGAELIDQHRRGEAPTPEMLDRLRAASDALIDRLTLLQSALIDRNAEFTPPQLGGRTLAEPEAERLGQAPRTLAERPASTGELE